MKISYNWLKQYINLDIGPDSLSTILTNIGLEVEGMETFQSVQGGLDGVIIGEVITCEPHSNADKLSVTTVDIGNNILPIVCGAPNVKAGQKVLVATVGTTLYTDDDSFEIKKAKIRGEVSEGMICAEDELGLGKSHDGIMVLPGDCKVGTKASDYFNIENDVIFEIGLTPNRSDAASHIGTARDLVAGLNRHFNTDKYELTIPPVDNFNIDNTNLDINIEVLDTDACPRYSGISITDVVVDESPDWLKTKLEAIGIRPINNIVDITNYVLHETGQPLHAFNADKITGNKVVIRKLQENTPFITLDEIERKLHHDDLMICNTHTGMCIAGVFGGTKSGVESDTTNIFLESAYFDSVHIRKTSKRHALQTDASFRFERGADPNITIYALKRAAKLILEVAGGKISSEVKDYYPNPVLPWPVKIRMANIDRLIGKSIDRNIIASILINLGIEIVSRNEEEMNVLIPTFKVDVTREVDVIEEILRIYGYNNIEISGKINTSINKRPNPDIEKIQNSVADYMVSQGFAEIMNNSLTKADYSNLTNTIDSNNNVNLLNPLSKDLNVLRQTLLMGGLETISYNLNRKAINLKLFEFGKSYQINQKYSLEDGVKHYKEENRLLLLITGNKNGNSWDNSVGPVDINTLTGIVNTLFEKMRMTNKLSITEDKSDIVSYMARYMLNNKFIAEIGKVSKSLLKQFDIGQEVFFADINWSLLIENADFNDTLYKPVSKFPAVKRDLSIVLDKNIRFTDLKEAAMKAEKKLLQSVSLFDIYEGSNIDKNKKSYALSFVLMDETKTLTDKVIDKTMKRILYIFEQQFNAQLR